MKHLSKPSLLLILGLACSSLSSAQTKFQPQDTEFYEPKSRVVHASAHKAPSDAIVLFDGKDLKQWVSAKNQNSAAPWTIKDGVLTVKPGAGDIQTIQNFEDFQFHLEWKSPEVIKGEGQGRGNSGVFLQGKYEIQVLDNHNNSTYVNGQAGSIYKQRQPLVSVRPADGEWHSYDILYTAPRFNADGILIKKATVTLLHNGVLAQYNTQIEGTTEYIGLPQVIPHGAGPIILQDHGDLVNFRNIWIRPL